MTMHLFDPTRPKLGNGSPCLLTGGAAPTIYLTPLTTGRWRLMTFLLVRGVSQYKPYHKDVDWSQVAAMLQKWQEDPEACCKLWFDYTGPEGPSGPEPEQPIRSDDERRAWLKKLGLIP